MTEMKTLTLNGVKYNIDDAEAVKFTEQNLTDAQKAQARENIGIANTSNTTSYGYEINPDLNLLVMGDSLFGSVNGAEWLRGFGCNLRNHGVVGASLARIDNNTNNDGSYKSILNQWDKFKKFKNGEETYELEAARINKNGYFTEPDIILVDGGSNDYLFGAPMGTLNNNPYTYEGNVTYDESTVMGALETLLRDIAFTCPKAQRFFLIIHRVYHCVGNDSTGTITRNYWSTTVKSGGYNYDTLRENIIKACNMYGFKIIDLYNDSLLNVVPPSDYTYQGNQTVVANAELLDAKGIHPTLEGYRVGYDPYVKQALSLGTKK